MISHFDPVTVSQLGQSTLIFSHKKMFNYIPSWYEANNLGFPKKISKRASKNDAK